MAYTNKAYANAVRDGMFNTDDVPEHVAREIREYEAAIYQHCQIIMRMQRNEFSDRDFADTMIEYSEGAIDNMVCAVRELREKQKESIKSAALSHNDDRRKVAECAA
ncbi:hypothetical protein [Acetobacter pasteurianus]|uniref:Uncharacterized protein n=1 Tax=Acetobacter pasteurianus NBRC 3278 TaxID=1226660 RepID=A0A401X927_ACEPA|nr:hypothetical protein [Acetobacter pasteurianus]GCD60795.1 hypothetical protein NBRC3277_3370 [Acetobacter pasteurianus NBRC 3277]GCD64401.1 hypothetical protein NBRC3278_3494 [Acetobacter pasteurianus NBRC 3278]